MIYKPKYNQEIHHRRSIRLRGYDYSQNGAYFITICTQNRECLFGEIIDGKMVLNDAGKMLQNVWDDIPHHYGVEIDTVKIMPNHIHGIINIVTSDAGGIIVRADPHVCPNSDINIKGQPQGVAPTTATLSLLDVVHRFKTLTTKKYTDGIKQNVWKSFNGKLWQRNYYEHIIRNEESLFKIRTYIINNPLNWEYDKENPDHLPVEKTDRSSEML